MQFTIAVMVIVSGIASQYSPDTMRQVAVVRDWQGYPIANLPHIAVSDCADVGKVRTIRYPGHDWESAQVIDCARDGDGTAKWMAQNGILLEMSYRRAVELDTVGRGIAVEMIAIEFHQVEQCEEHCIVMED
jgi:hypothetical protein